MATVKVPHDFPWPLKQLDVKKIGDKIGVDWSQIPLTEFEAGFKEEMEHGSHDPQTDVTHDDPIATGKIALAHLKEDPHYYSKLERAMKMISAKAVQSKARKMVARKGVESQIPSVISVKQKIDALASKAVSKGVTKADLLPIVSAIKGLMNLSDLFEQSQLSLGEDRPYAGREWISSCKYVIENLKYCLYEAQGTESWTKDSQKAARNQARYLKNASDACSNLISDIKRLSRNNAQSGRHR